MATKKKPSRATRTKAKATTAKAAPKTKAVKEPVVEEAPVVEAVAEPVVEETPVVEAVAETVVEETPVVEAVAEPVVEETPAVKVVAELIVEEAPVVEEVAEPVVEETPVVEEVAEQVEAKVYEPTIEELYGPRRSIVFIGSECYPFVKTGGLGDVMYALPRVLAKQNCDVKVILPRYACIPNKWQEKMVYKGSFYMDLCSDGKSYYVGIMEYVNDGVVYDFIDNDEFFSWGKPYTDLVVDIPKYCFFGKAALAALNYMNWVPDIIHCHDWQAGLVPVYLRTLFADTALSHAKVITTIHNLRFQGIYNIDTFKYWTNLPDYVFDIDCLGFGNDDANMLKGGLAYSDVITTVSGTYAEEIKTPFFGENLDGHMRFHANKLCGIVNGIDVELWNPDTDKLLAVNYNAENVIEKKKLNKAALQEELGLNKDDSKFVVGLVSRLTNQKGLDLVNAIVERLMDGNTQIVILGTGDAEYENSFRYFENAYKGDFAACIQYDEARAHRIYAGCDAMLIPSLFEPCGLTQLYSMKYGSIPIVRETGGLKDTVEPYNQFFGWGNGFTFIDYYPENLLDCINRAKTVYFENRDAWNEMVVRDMNKDVSWENSARQYKNLYLSLANW
jgi:ADP-glucose type glycogen/starch synthase